MKLLKPIPQIPIRSALLKRPLALTTSLAMTLVLGVIMAGCSSPRTKPAPVTDRNAASVTSMANEPTPSGYYRVKRGDTLLRISLDHGQSYKDIALWNNLSDPNQIEVDQLLLIKSPTASKSASVASTASKKLPAGESVVGSAGVAKAAVAKGDGSKADAMKNDTMKSDASSSPVAEPGIRLSWPAQGKVVEEFSEGKNKGIDIAGKLGEPVQASADGKVVYAGNSLRGYGNLVIVKHDNTYLTAYAYNKSLLVKEGDSVRKGQKIAEMGDTDTNAVKLHFEVRVNGKPVNPMQFLQ